MRAGRGNQQNGVMQAGDIWPVALMTVCLLALGFVGEGWCESATPRGIRFCFLHKLSDVPPLLLRGPCTLSDPLVAVLLAPNRPIFLPSLALAVAALFVVDAVM